jgi:hypothetical protein
MIRPFPRPARHLGSFTVAQWPPIAPRRGDVATLADTYDAVAFSWQFEYRPDLDATYPWRALANQGSTIKGMEPGDNSNNAPTSWGDITVGGSTDKTSFLIPRGGEWYFGLRYYPNSGGIRNVGFGIGTADPTTFYAPAGDYPSQTHTQTITVSAASRVIAKHRTDSGNSYVRALTVYMRPVKIS